MSEKRDPEKLVRKVKELANDHFSSPEVQYYLNTRLTLPRARRWVANTTRFVQNRRHCWALAMGEAPLNVKKEIWRHEQDELISDPRAGGADHFTLSTEEAELFGVSKADLERTEPHPFVVAALDAWLHLGRKSWLESLSAVAVVEMVNSNAIISGGGFSYRMRQKLMSELGIQRERLKDKNVHVEADQEHASLFERVIPQYLTGESERTLVMAAVKRALVIDRAYRGGLGFAMQQIPLETP